MKIVIASSNKHKIQEIQGKFAQDTGLTFIAMHEVCPPMDIIENGLTFEENALIKARAVAAECSLPVLADDSGICVDALGGEPGIYSARYGNCAHDNERNVLLLANMKDIPDSRRSARFICVIALVLPDGREFTAQGTCEGAIIREKKGTKGFGYDPIFLILNDTRTMAELTPEEKNTISHRAIALDNIRFNISSLHSQETRV